MAPPPPTTTQAPLEAPQAPAAMPGGHPGLDPLGHLQAPQRAPQRAAPSLLPAMPDREDRYLPAGSQDRASQNLPAESDREYLYLRGLVKHFSQEMVLFERRRKMVDGASLKDRAVCELSLAHLLLHRLQQRLEDYRRHEFSP